MMDFINTSQHTLTQHGLVVFARKDFCLIVKPKGLSGNAIPNWSYSPVIQWNEAGEVVETILSDCPILGLRQVSNGFEVSCWQFVPGPGPGDFETSFDTLEAAFACILQYFFKKNEAFEAFKSYKRTH